MKKTIVILVLIIAVSSLYAQDISFKHDWQMEYTKDCIKFTSQKKTPYPYSSSKAPRAVMYFTRSNLDKPDKNALQNIVAEEIQSIKKELHIDKPMVTGSCPAKTITTCYDTVNNVEIAIIEYRFTKGQPGQISFPKKTRQIIFTHKGIVWKSSLVVIYEADQNSMKHDQETLLKELIGNLNGNL